MQHLYECLRKDTTYNPAQGDQYIQLDEPKLPDFLHHFDEEKDPLPCCAMTNPYETLLLNDTDRICVRVVPDMLHSFQPTKQDLKEPDTGTDVWYPKDSGKNHFHQLSLWSIMSDRPSYTIHPEASGVGGSGCMDFCIGRLNYQNPIDELETPSIFESIEAHDYLFHQTDTVAELNINRSYDDLFDVSTTYLGTDLVQITDVFSAQPSFPITLDCHTDGELLGGGKLDIVLDT